MKHITTCLTLLVTSSCLPAFSQTIFTDGDGKGSIISSNGSIAQIDFGKNTGKISYLNDVAGRTWRYGFEAEGALSDGKVSFLNKNRITPKTTFTFTTGVKNPFNLWHKGSYYDTDLESKEKSNANLWDSRLRDTTDSEIDEILEKKDLNVDKLNSAIKNRFNETLSNNELDDLKKEDSSKRKNLLKKRFERNKLFNQQVNPEGFSTKLPVVVFDQFSISINQSRSSFNLLDRTKTLLKEQIKSTSPTYNGYSANYNMLLANPTLILGISYSSEKTNNLDDLDVVTLTDTVFTSSSGGINRTGTVTKTAYDGSFTDFDKRSLRTDTVWFPKLLEGRIGINLFTRTNMAQGETIRGKGIGIFLTDEKIRKKVIGGISYTESGTDRVFGIVSGFNF